MRKWDFRESHLLTFGLYEREGGGSGEMICSVKPHLPPNSAIAGLIVAAVVPRARFFVARKALHPAAVLLVLLENIFAHHLTDGEAGFAAHRGQHVFFLFGREGLILLNALPFRLGGHPHFKNLSSGIAREIVALGEFVEVAVPLILRQLVVPVTLGAQQRLHLFRELL